MTDLFGAATTTWNTGLSTDTRNINADAQLVKKPTGNTSRIIGSK
jgi:hypothetical protein